MTTQEDGLLATLPPPAANLWGCCLHVDTSDSRLLLWTHVASPPLVHVASSSVALGDPSQGLLPPSNSWWLDSSVLAVSGGAAADQGTRSDPTSSDGATLDQVLPTGDIKLIIPPRAVTPYSP